MQKINTEIERPNYIKPILDGIPEELKAIPRWVVWKSENREGRWTKPPLRSDGHGYASVTNPDTWSTFDDAWTAYRDKHPDGVGFVLNGDDIVGLDFDKCRCPALDSVDDRIAKSLDMVLPEIAKHLRNLNAYTEVSPSGRGIRAFLKGPLPVDGKRKGPIEVYKNRRYVTLTGQTLDGFPKTVPDRTAELTTFYKDVFRENGDGKTVGLKQKKLQGKWLERLDRAFASKKGTKIRRLYDGNCSGYPSQSEADLALCSHLAFWFEGDMTAMDEAFRTSGLMREKWNELRGEETYGQKTITKAVTGCSSFYGDRKISNEDVLRALDRNEEGDAELFISLHKEKFVFDHTAESWYRWRDNYWELDSTEESLAGVTEVCGLYAEEMKRQAIIRIDSVKSSEEKKASNAKKLEDALSKRIRNLQTLRRKKAVVHLAKVGDGSLGITGEEWDRNPWALPVSNGVIDLKNGDFRSGVPADFFKTVAPTEWVGLNEKCPRWEKFLQEIFDEDAKLISFMHRLLGYSVTGLTVKHILLMLCGIGRNGKSTLIEIIGHVLGKISGQGDPELILEGRFYRISGAPSSDIMALRGRRLVWISETSEGKRLSPGRVKWLTGGDTLTGRGIREKHQTSFTPTHTLFLLTNAKPKANAQDFALWERVLLIPFNLTFVNEPDQLKPNERKADLHLLEKLKAEAPGILAWLVRGCLAWQKEGLNPPPKVKMATAQYRKDEDILKRFIEEGCITGETYSVRAGGFYEAYTQWAKDNGELPINSKEFGEYMTKTFEWKKDNKGKLYHGIGLL